MAVKTMFTSVGRAHPRKHCLGAHLTYKRRSYQPSRTRVHAEIVEEDVLQPGLIYSADWNELYWRTRPVTVQKRLIQIGWYIAKWQLWKRLNAGRSDAHYVLQRLTELGPAFVKIGQAISTRPDVIPPEYLRELEKLQDNIPSFSSAEAFAVIEADVGPIRSIFSTITPEPVAAASLGQVYKGTLQSNGKVVAVKVQRPRVLETIALDIFILRNLAGWFRKFKKLNSDLPGLIDEWASSIYREISYVGELQNAAEFRERFTHYVEIYVPEMYPEFSSERVLTMEWVDGTKPRSASDVAVGSSTDDLRLVEVGVRCSLEQMLQEGFYHADPHPGNILRMSDGRLCYLDFGMMGRIERPVRQALIRATMHLVNSEYEYLSADFVTLGLLPRDAVAPKEEIVRALTGVFADAVSRGVSEISFNRMSSKLGTTMYQYKFKIPTYFTLLVRTFAILEGIALAADPNYKVLGAAYPWLARRLLTDKSTELQTTLRTLLYKENVFKFSRLENLLIQAIKSPSRPTAAVLASPANTNLPVLDAGKSTGALELLLSDDGNFLRDIVFDELAKGIDAAWRINLDQVQHQARKQALSLLGLTGREQTITEGTITSAPAAQFVTFMMGVPSLSNQGDVEQVQGVSRLLTLMQELAMKGRSTEVAPSGANYFDMVQSSFSMLQWIAEETRSLPREAQQRALLLPADLLARISSRAAARSIRLLLGVTEPQLRKSAPAPVPTSSP